MSAGVMAGHGGLRGHAGNDRWRRRRQRTAQSVTDADIQRLQDEVYQAGADVSRLRTTTRSRLAGLQDELDTLREEVIYLKVKLRKESNVSRSEYTAVRDQLQNLRSERAANPVPREASPPVPPGRPAARRW